MVEHYDDASDLIYAAVNGSDFDRIREIREGVQKPTSIFERITSAIFMSMLSIRSVFRVAGRMFGRRSNDVVIKD